MTRVWIAATLAALVTVLAVTEFNLTKNTSNDICEILKETEYSAKHTPDKLNELCGDMKKIWERKKINLAMFLSHEEIDEIEISIEKLNRLAVLGKYEELYVECGTLYNHIEGLKETEYISLHNIL